MVVKRYGSSMRGIATVMLCDQQQVGCALHKAMDAVGHVWRKGSCILLHAATGTADRSSSTPQALQ